MAKKNKKFVCPLEPAGYRILLEMKVVENVSEGGIIMATKLESRREQAAMEEGTVVAIGPTAYLGTDGEPWIKVGDVVKYKRYEGVIITERDDDGKEYHYRILNDDDVYCKVKK